MTENEIKPLKGIVSVTGRKDPNNPQHHIRITTDVQQALNIKTGDKLWYEVKDGKIIIAPVKE